MALISRAPTKWTILTRTLHFLAVSVVWLCNGELDNERLSFWRAAGTLWLMMVICTIVPEHNERKLYKHTRMQSEILLGSVSHEMRTPVQVCAILLLHPPTRCHSLLPLLVLQITQVISSNISHLVNSGLFDIPQEGEPQGVITPTKPNLTTKDYNNHNLKWIFTDHIRGEKPTTISKRSIIIRFRKALKPEWNGDRDWGLDPVLFAKLMASSDMEALPLHSKIKKFTSGNRYWKLLTQGIYWAYENNETTCRKDLDDTAQQSLLEQDPLVKDYVARVENRHKPRKGTRKCNTEPTKHTEIYALIQQQNDLLQSIESTQQDIIRRISQL